MDLEKMIIAVCQLIKKESGVDLLKEEKVEGRKRDSKGRFVKKTK